MNIINEYCVFILTHGRPHKQKTFKTLLSGGFTGGIYFIVDNEDSKTQDYIDLYGIEKVIIFDKLEMSKNMDTMDNFENRKTIVFARNKCWDIAKQLGYNYFIQLDDDYNGFYYTINKNNEYIELKVKNLDILFSNLVDYYKKIDCNCLAIAQTGDFIGGGNGGFFRKFTIKRKMMNFFICSEKKRFQFIGRINEDVNTYTSGGGNGKKFFTIPNIKLSQTETQSSTGGMTEVYIDKGTYIKSFYSVIASPSCVKIAMMGVTSKRIHHRVNWNNCTPKILEEKYKRVLSNEN